MNTQTIYRQLEYNLSQHSNPVVSCSFGKDSLVVLHIVRQIYPEIPVVFNNTKVEYPDTLTFKRQLVDEWNLNLIEIKPLNGWTFWRVVEKYGFPIGQRRGASATSKCCYYLKKAPMKQAMRTYNWDLVFDGMNISESRQRFWQFSKYSDNCGYRYNKEWKCHKLSPIVDWTPSDVWDRVGCWCCTIPLKYNSYHLTHLRTFYPKLHKLLLKRGLAQFLIDEGKGTEIYRHINPNWIVEYRPCYFDGVTI